MLQIKSRPCRMQRLVQIHEKDILDTKQKQEHLSRACRQTFVTGSNVLRLPP